MPSTLFPLQVTPILPPALRRLADLSENFLFSWYPATGQLFRHLDSALWRKVESNPKLFLKCVDQGILERAAEDPKFLEMYRTVIGEFDRYLAPSATPAGDLEADDLIAYFCAEYGLHESFPIYSGGLGVLAGDHCKTASDLRLPFVAVGLMYGQGYFRQAIDRNGQQVPDYPAIEPHNTPIACAHTPSGAELRVSCPLRSMLWRKYPWPYMSPTATNGSRKSLAVLQWSPASTPRPPE